MKQVKMVYGFVSDPALSLLHIVSNVILAMPAWLYYTRPQNIAYHNLCLPTFYLPPGLKSLLGLGLNFCTRPELTNKKSDVLLSRFTRDCNTFVFFRGTEKPHLDCKLFLRSDWTPDEGKIPLEFRSRVNSFTAKIGSFFNTRKRTSPNLLPSQLAAFQWIKNHDNVVIFPTDKNLGPAIMERDRYIGIALSEHLNDTTTYRKLDETTADRRILTITIIIKQIITTLQQTSRSRDATFLK